MATITLTTAYGSYTFPSGHFRLGDDLINLPSIGEENPIRPETRRISLARNPKSRTVRIEGFIVGSSVDDCWSKRNSLLKALPVGAHGKLTYTQGSSTWELDVLVSNITVQDRQGAFVMQCEVVLKSLSGYWRESRAPIEFITSNIDTDSTTKKVYSAVLNNQGTAPAPFQVRVKSPGLSWTNPQITVLRKNLLKNSSIKDQSSWTFVNSNPTAGVAYFSPNLGINDSGCLIIGNTSSGGTSDYVRAIQTVNIGWLGSPLYVCFSVYVRVVSGYTSEIVLSIVPKASGNTLASYSSSTFSISSTEWQRINFTADIGVSADIGGTVYYADYVDVRVQKGNFTSVGTVAIDNAQLEIVGTATDGPSEFVDTNLAEYEPVSWKRIDPLTGAASSVTIDNSESAYLIDFASGRSWNGSNGDSQNTNGVIADAIPGRNLIVLGGNLVGGDLIASYIPRFV